MLNPHRLFAGPFPKLNVLAPSVKNGRFSEKKSAERGSKASWPASASIWEKSGLTVPFIVRLLVIPHRTLPPSLGRSAS